MEAKELGISLLPLPLWIVSLCWSLGVGCCITSVLSWGLGGTLLGTIWLIILGWINAIGNGAVGGCRLMFRVEKAGVSVGVVDANGNPPAAFNLISSKSIILNRTQNWGRDDISIPY